MSGCEDQDPYQWAEWCPICARAVKEREASEGKRCANCLESFDKRYPFRSPTSPELCFSCERAANAPRTTRGATYGTVGPYRDAPQPAPDSTESAQKPSGGVLDQTAKEETA